MLVEILHKKVNGYSQGQQVPASSFTTTELARLVALGAVRELGEEENVSEVYQETVTPFEEFQGLSTGDKPSGADIGAGSIYYETDTGDRWMWDGQAWAEISREELNLRLQFANNRLLSRILDTLEGNANESADSR